MQLVGAYVAFGFIFALAFVSIGVARIDPLAKGAGLGFRLLILPGVVALWPLLLVRWIGGQREPAVERNPHREAARRAP